MTKKNPLIDYEQTKEAAKADRKEKEMELWRRWKQTKKPEHLEPLLQAYEPLIGMKMRAWRAPHAAPESAFKADLQTHLIKAFESYDPSRGASLNTHVHIRLQKSKRYNLKNQNMAYIPAGQASLITPIARAKEELTEQYGREPSSSEIATHLQSFGEKDFGKITAKRVDTVLKAQRRDVPASSLEGLDEHFPSFEEEQIAVASKVLPDIFPGKEDLHRLFNHTFGTNGFQQIRATSQLAKKMGKTDQQISHMKTQMGGTLKRFMGYDPEDEE
jgi:DNA-directed RNA polymerase specialized sigma subunit